MSRTRLVLALLVALVLVGGAVPAIPLAAEGAPPEPTEQEGVPRTPPAKLPLDREAGLTPAPLRAQADTPPVGTVRTWAALDDLNRFYYLKDYTLRAVGEQIEVWVASDQDEISAGLAFPEGDCRNDERIVLTDDQIAGLVAAYDGTIHPRLSEVFSVAPAREGANPRLGESIPGVAVPAGYYAGEGDNVVTLVDNVRDDNFYDRDLQAERATYLAGFFSQTFNAWFDRNVMTIDAYDWLHRTGAHPPDEPVPGDLCASKPARPFSYESTFAHEYQHLLESYEDPDEVSWVNEGLSTYAEYVAGYTDPAVPIERLGYSSHVQCFLGHYERQTPANPNPRKGGPENSLTGWEDQPGEILCDYGAASTFMHFVAARYGRSFLTKLHRHDDPGLQGLRALVADADPGRSAQDVLHGWAAMVALDGPVDDNGGVLLAGSADRLRTPALHTSIAWDNDDAWSTPGAPPNGSDYVRLRDAAGDPVGARALRSLTFDGGDTLMPHPVEWQVAPDPPDRPGDPALHSGTEVNLDRSIVLSATVPADDPTLTFESRWALEAGWDFGFVQVSTDGGRTYTSLPGTGTTTETDPAAIPAVRANVPGYTGASEGWVTETVDLSAFAGREALLAFRLITDPAVTEPGWWVDDVTVGGQLLSDGSSLDPFRSPTEVAPVPVPGFSVQLVGYHADGRPPAFLRPLRLGPGFEGELAAWERLLIRLGGADVVAAIVTFDDPSETIREYAPYTLTVNGVVQPGGGAAGS